MKVLDVTEFWSERGGGARSHVMAKAQALAGRGHESVVVAPGPRDEETRADGAGPLSGGPEPRGAGSARLVRVKGPATPYDPTYHVLWRLDRVLSLIRQERPDVLEAHSPYLALAASLGARERWYGVRTFFWHADFIDTYARARLVPRLGERGATRAVEPLWRAWRRPLARMDSVIVASRTQRTKLLAHGLHSVALVPFGVDTETFRPAGAPPAAAKATVLCVGRLAVEKRWDVALDAFFALRRTHDARLVFLGDGPERAALEAKARGRDDVSFVGYEEDRERYAARLAHAHVLLHACPYETFGLAVAEAVASALPVVVPDSGGAAEAAVGNAAARTYRALDAEDAARALRETLDRPYDALFLDARAAAARARPADAHFAETLALYARLLGAS